MAPGMIVSNEPGYYATGRFGIRIENLQYVRAAKNAGDKHRDMLEFDALTLAPIDRRLIDKSALTEEEKLWLNTYHAEVLARLNRLSIRARQGGLKRLVVRYGEQIYIQPVGARIISFNHTIVVQKNKRKPCTTTFKQR
ncbi:MAG: hypothetical protein CM15mP21_0840 [Hyphomicrobiales bacterium]|nr:MAG: hypothetical protein CM15mP21_0840 [Hyphomicrobiales bacterium]